MLIFPAIDLYEGQAVRLFKGDYAQKTVYSDDPLSVARDFVRAGARQMHLVDLEGARSGGTPNFDIIRRIKEETGAFCETGGGIRTLETVAKYVESGIDRVILGTAAVTEKGLVREAVKRFGEKIAVGIDLADGLVAIRGWRERTALTAEAFFAQMRDEGVSCVICTDISRDGAMRGTNRALYRSLSEAFPMRLIASGGVSSMDDVLALARLGLYGAIIGKAYYTGAIALADAIRVAQ